MNDKREKHLRIKEVNIKQTKQHYYYFKKTNNIFQIHSNPIDKVCFCFINDIILSAISIPTSKSGFIYINKKRKTFIFFKKKLKHTAIESLY